MKQNQQHKPLYTALIQFNQQHSISFHVPGHKNGTIFPHEARNAFKNILPIDVTELTGLDDLHAASGVIAEAEQLAADFFHADHTFFLVGGSTAGNLAMIMATCAPGEKVIVQRNSHKSIINGLELSGANPVFIAPEYDEAANRYTSPSLDTLKAALRKYPEAKAVVLTYPDYFGRTYAIDPMIQLAHAYDIPVLVDEAHGAHFILGDPFPASSLALGADLAVQSAHKMAPAMTMASYLHIAGQRISNDRVAHYLQMLQSSSPSYPLMASLDIARAFLATFSERDMKMVLGSVQQVRRLFANSDYWNLIPLTTHDDPLKITLSIKQGYTGFTVAHFFEQAGIYPELAADHHVLFIHGLQAFQKLDKLSNAIKQVQDRLKITAKHATIEVIKQFPAKINTLAMSYEQMRKCQTAIVPFQQAKDKVAAEAVIPYPPGIPLIMKGEQVTGEHIKRIEQLIMQGAAFQHRDLTSGIRILMKKG
ncbi:aminotransferase class I/II-fold pyridoxal phosphate-dependent enzyme [Lentibacillus sp. N15]|uniref:aminotransferase class I/II-fold pyridoxal phosphate-dependent enzyme n=1 Tax=Lentibacillus songyuanensis TaxID=3136161 RepID=UPI0031B9DD75